MFRCITIEHGALYLAKSSSRKMWKLMWNSSPTKKSLFQSLLVGAEFVSFMILHSYVHFFPPLLVLFFVFYFRFFCYIVIRVFIFQNKTGIVDVDGRRCFVMALNRSLVLPPKTLLDVVLRLRVLIFLFAVGCGICYWHIWQMLGGVLLSSPISSFLNYCSQCTFLIYQKE